MPRFRDDGPVSASGGGLISPLASGEEMLSVRRGLKVYYPEPPFGFREDYDEGNECAAAVRF